MTLLPIQFWTKYVKKDFERLNKTGALDLIENYLEEKGFSYIKRTENKIVFHSLFNGWGIFDIRTTLVSGVIKINDKKDEMTITNGNWTALLLAVPFLFFIVLSKSEFSTLDENDLGIVWVAFFWLFGGNLIIRIITHLSLNGRIKNLIIKNYAQQRL